MFYQLLDEKQMNKSDCAKMQAVVFGDNLSFFFEDNVIDFFKAD